MIRSSSHSLRHTNPGKRTTLAALIAEYRRFVQVLVDDLWVGGFYRVNPSKNSLDFKGFSLLPTEYLKTHSTWLSARMQQAAGKQAIMLVKSATEVRRKQLWMLAKLQQAPGKFKNLQSKIDLQPLVKPDASQINLELDSRFVDFQDPGEGFSFVRLKSIGRKLQVNIPVQKTAVSDKWGHRGKRKTCVRLSDKRIYLMYDIPEALVEGAETVGADQGLLDVLTLSDGQVTPHEDSEGHTLKSIQERLARRKRGSKGFRRAQTHRRNHIGWSLNQLCFENIRELRLEKIQDLRKSERCSRLLSHWTYPLIKQKVVRLSEEEGFRFKEVPNEFRSQRCSVCGWVRKSNRKGKTFVCGVCGHSADADANAASNLAIDLFEIPWWVRKNKMNRKGFYWSFSGLFDESQECIVPVTQKREDLASKG